MRKATSKDVNLIGQRNGRLLCVEYLGLFKRGDGRNNKKWRCVCDCGKEKIVTTNEFHQAISCGCYRNDVIHKTRYKGGYKRLYKVWVMMKDRCFNCESQHYANYGGRGITVCDEWIDSFGNFKEWALSTGYSKDAPRGECTLDRIDTDKNYEPTNCKWSTMKEQSNNKRNNIKITMDGETKTIVQWCEEYKADPSRVYYRIKHGYSLKDALTIKPYKLRKEV